MTKIISVTAALIGLSAVFIVILAYQFASICVSTFAYYCLATAIPLILLSWNRRRSKFVDANGKSVFITGCDSGFGLKLAQRLDGMGYQVFAGCLNPNQGGAKTLVQTASNQLSVVRVDVTDDWQVQTAFTNVCEKLKDNELWAVVNNAGIAALTEIEWCSLDQFKAIMDVNVLGVVRVTKAFLPLLRRSQGRVINVASLAGRVTLPAFSAYSMSKKACIAFSDGLRLEMKKFNISVITIEPGIYKTPMCQEGYLIDMSRKSWAETPTNVKEDYGEEYFNAFLQVIRNASKSARPQVTEVIDHMVKAVCEEKPRNRYVPYWRTYLQSIIAKFSQDFVMDAFYQKLSVKIPPSFKTRNLQTQKSSSTGRMTPNMDFDLSKVKLSESAK